MDEVTQGWKILLEYEVGEESLQEYYQFVMQQYVPALQSMGFQMSEAWHTAYGLAPNRLLGFVCEDRDTIASLLDSELWGELNEELGNYVTDFSFKVVPFRGGFQF